MPRNFFSSLKLFFQARRVVRIQNRQLRELSKKLNDRRRENAALQNQVALADLRELGVIPPRKVVIVSRDKTRRADLS